MRINLRESRLPWSVGMDMAPLIDVVFQLLIFFMLTSAFVVQPGVKVHLPKAATAQNIPQQSLVISVLKGDLLTLGPQVVTLQELSRRLKGSETAGRSILIRADRSASMGRVVEVWDLCRSLGVSQINIATQEDLHDH